jgi:hypothetical protein
MAINNTSTTPGGASSYASYLGAGADLAIETIDPREIRPGVCLIQECG